MIEVKLFVHNAINKKATNAISKKTTNARNEAQRNSNNLDALLQFNVVNLIII